MTHSCSEPLLTPGDLDIYIRIVNMVLLSVGNLGRQRITERTSLKYNPVGICWLFSKKVIYASDAEVFTHLVIVPEQADIER